MICTQSFFFYLLLKKHRHLASIKQNNYYRRWKGRKVGGRLGVTEGLRLSSWNAREDANGESGSAELAGIQVSKLTPWFHEYDYVAYDDRDRAAAMQRQYGFDSRLR